MYLNSQILGRGLNCLNWFWTSTSTIPYNVSFDGTDFQSEMYLGMIVFVMHFRLEINSINTDVVRYYSCWSSKSVRTILTVSIQICTIFSFWTIPSHPPKLFELILNSNTKNTVQRQSWWNWFSIWNASRKRTRPDMAFLALTCFSWSSKSILEFKISSSGTLSPKEKNREHLNWNHQNCSNWFWTPTRRVPYNLSVAGIDFQSEIQHENDHVQIQFRLEISSI